MCMLTYPAGLEGEILFRVFIYIHSLSMPAAKAMGSLGLCAGSPEPMLFEIAVGTKISFSGSYIFKYGPVLD